MKRCFKKGVPTLASLARELAEIGDLCHYYDSFHREDPACNYYRKRYCRLSTVLMDWNTHIFGKLAKEYIKLYPEQYFNNNK